jgi:hypothetical protein
MADTSIDYGVAHYFGLYGTREYMTVQSDDWAESFALDVEVADVVGRVITDRLDDYRQEITIDGVLLAGQDTPTLGTQMTYGGVQWIMKSIDDKGTNKDFRKVSVKGIKYQEIA